MGFVAVKSEEQRAALNLHKVRDLLVRQQTIPINACVRTVASTVSLKSKACRRQLTACADAGGSKCRIGSCAIGPAKHRDLVALAKEIEHLKTQILDWRPHDEVSQLPAPIDLSRWGCGEADVGG